MKFLSFLLFAAPSTTSGQPATGGGWQMIIFIVLMIAIFYFLLIRPQQKRQKEEQKKRDSLTKGDKIITIGGIHGKIVEIQDNTITIEVEDASKMRVEKSAVNPVPEASK